jgi:phospholipid/cholesterol/gamma-HCH transport system substrate-binding protein
VRFAGIDVGTVESVEIINDSSVKVVMRIEDKLRDHIHKNALASIGTDGLMGNKLININSVKDNSSPVDDGDVLTTLAPIETDEMLRTLNTTNENIEIISADLKQITGKINNSNALWTLLADTVATNNIRQAIVNIKLTGNRTAIITGDLSQIVEDVKAGKGSIGALLTDSSFSTNLNQAVIDINVVSNNLALVSGDLKGLSEQIKSGKGAVGTLLMDTNFVHNLNQSLENIRNGADGFNQNMEALKHSFLLRKYFKKQEKEKLKTNQ